MMVMDNFEVKQIGSFEYRLVRQDSEQTSVQVDNDGKFWFYIPNHVSDEDIESEIQRYSVQIFNASTKKVLPIDEYKDFVEGEIFPFLGSNYSLKIVNDSVENLVLENDAFFINQDEEIRFRETFKKWYIEQSKTLVQERITFFQQQIDVTPSKVIIAELNNKWGCCTPGKVIKIHWKLITLPQDIFDYVIVHELAHLKHLNHSSKFWSEVEFILPDYRIKLATLDEFILR